MPPEAPKARGPISVMGQVCLALVILWPSLALTGEPAMVASVLEDDLAFMKEEELVYTAIRHEQPISEAPSNVYVITAEDVRHSGATDIPTLLRRVPGMEVMQVTGAEYNVSIRGNNQLNANKLLVLLDGASVYQDVQGTVLWKALPITLPEIARIEVLKGPSSALYGFNAYDGVINIITKSPKETTGMSIQGADGELGTVHSAAMFSNSIGIGDVRLVAGYEQNQKWRDNDSLAFRAYKLNGQFERIFAGDSKFSLSGNFVENNRFDGPTVGAAIVTHTATNGRVTARFTQPHTLIQVWWDGRWSDARQTFPAILNILQIQNTDGRITQEVNTQTADALIQHDWDFTDNRLTVGVNYRFNTVSGNFTGSAQSENRLGLYLQDEWHIHPQVETTAGVRYDLDTFINPTISPRLVVLAKATSTQIFRMAFEMAYRPPTLTETHVKHQVLTNLPPPNPSPPPIPVMGSGNLKPEKILSFTMGYHGWFLNHRLRARLDGFYNHLTNLISPSDFGGVLTFVNSKGHADIWGGEGSLEFLIMPWLEGFTNVAYQEIDQTIKGENRRAGPKWKVNGGLRGNWLNGLNGEVSLHYYGTVTYPITGAFSNFAPFGVSVPNPRVGSYTLLNLRLGYGFWMDRAEAAISVSNALDDRHKEYPVGDTIGSRVLGWVTLKFD